MNGIRLLVCYLSFYFCVADVFAEELAVESFSQLPSHMRPNLSPGGKKIAYIKNYLSPEVTVLTSVDLVTGKRQLLVKSDNEKIKIKWFTWANEKTLIVSVKYTSTQGRTDYTETRLLAVDIDGEKPLQRQIAKPKRSQRASQFQDTVVSFLPDDPEHILVALDLDKANLPGVYKVNIYNDKKSRVVRGRAMIRNWMADRQGQVRLGSALDYTHGDAGIKVQIGDDNTWHKMFEYNALKDPAITPLGFAKDPNILYYSQYKGDKKALYKIDLTSKESELVFEDENYDVDGSLIYSRKTNDVIGVYHSHSEDGRVYWDESRHKFQKSLNRALPGKDVYLVDFSQDESIYLLYTENDFTPGTYYFGNRKEKSLVPVLDQYPALLPEVLTEHKFVTYTARDGTELEGYLTLPLGAAGPVATILHPHGGPGAREYDGFDYWTSFFANRGYAVFRPNFRGSTGYGYEFAQSQMQGWGLTMQDDLTDAANWLVEQNIALKDKMCIVGSSYGGYAAAMAAVKTPDLFKCAISFAGVTDLKKLVSTSRRYLNSKFVKKQLGADSEDLKSRSPAYHADKVKIPLLFIHGEDDVVVAVEQSEAMVSALRSLDKEVEFIELENGDHYLSIQRNRHITFKAMDTFLNKHLN
ncbi:MAG: prolyl oligopeptidase family serine peptidase [Paraglaciecola sp.]|uniref:alpha/beta hydrolase family protein n=1 Tax=Paraglaciecola sp. TaxID=1920173 RepID=UPI003298E8FA